MDGRVRYCCEVLAVCMSCQAMMSERRRISVGGSAGRPLWITTAYAKPSRSGDHMRACCISIFSSTACRGQDPLKSVALVQNRDRASMKATCRVGDPNNTRRLTMSDTPNEHRRPHPQPMAAPYLEFDIARE